MPPVDWLNGLPWNGVLIVLITMIVLLAVGSGLVWAVIKVRHEPVPSMLLITLGLLTLVCILGFTLTRYQVLGTLAAAGMGAIAGSLTNVLQPPNSKRQNESKEPDSGKEL